MIHTLSNVVDTYLFYPQHETLHGCFGKWLIFCFKQHLNELWIKLHAVVDALRAVGGIVCMKVSTSRPNPHAARSDIGVIMIYTPMHPLEEQTRQTILNVGQYLFCAFHDAQGFNAPLQFSPNNRIYYKTQEQSRVGSRMTGVMHNTLTSLILPKHCVKPSSSSSVPSNPLTLQKDPKTKMQGFTMTPLMLHNMGAVWNPDLNQWFAPNEKVAAKMHAAALQDARCAQPPSNDILSFLSINLWGNIDGFRRPEIKALDPSRMQQIASTIEIHQPDVLCLQEATLELLAILNPLLLEQGYVACSELCHQTIVYVHSVHITFHHVYNDDLKGCQLLQLTHKTTMVDFLACNVHFASGSTAADLRVLSLQQALLRLETAGQPFVLLGDTNFTFEQDPHVESSLPDYVKDAWAEAGSPANHRATYDYNNNTNLQFPDAERRSKVGARFDRAFFDSRTFTIQHFQLVCTNVMEDSKKHPSDHFGILNKNIVLKKKKKQILEQKKKRMWFLLFLCEVVSSIHHVLNWTVQWTVLAPDSYPRSVIVLRNTSTNDAYDNFDATQTRLIGGPTVRVKQGDTVEIAVTNRLLDSIISIHWHGLHMLHQVEMDGVVGITQYGILPMQTFVYKFNITQPPGMYFYHSHSGLQSSDGFQGSFIIEDNPMDIARDYVVAVQDWNHELYTTLHVKYTSRNGAYAGFQADYPYPTTSILINGRGQFDCLTQFVSQLDCDLVRKYGWQYVLHDRNESFALPTQPDSFRTNGQCNPSRPPYMGDCISSTQNYAVFECVQNSFVRLRIVGMGFSLGLRLWIDQHNVTIVAKDGYDIVPLEREAVFLHAGERLDVLVECAQEPYDFKIFAAVAYEYYGKRAHLKSPNVSSFAILRYVGASNASAVQCSPESWPQASIEPDYFYASNFDALAASERFIVWSNSKGHWWNYEQSVDGKRLEWWELNGHTPFMIPHDRPVLLESCGSNPFHNQNPLVFRLMYDEHIASVYEFVLVNNESQPHPWHVHGYTVDVVKIGPMTDVLHDDLFPMNETATFVMRADTFVIPSKSYAQFRLTANNPGPWLIHCHMPYHSEVGMAFLISVEYSGQECKYSKEPQTSSHTEQKEQTITQLMVGILMLLILFVPISVACSVCLLGALIKCCKNRRQRRVGVLNEQYVQDVSLNANFKTEEEDPFMSVNMSRRYCCC